MNKFNFSIFFDLMDYSYKDIFIKEDFVWSPLSKIKGFIKKMSASLKGISLLRDVYLENENQIFIGEGTTIEKGAYIKGPCIIGKNCQIRHGAYLRGNVITGDNCIIGHTTEVKNAILLNNVSAGHFAYIGDSILGNNVNLGAGVKLANFRLDRKKISFTYQDERINTDLRKFGAIIGDNCQIGCNSVLSPASFLGKNSICYPCINFSGCFFDQIIIKSTNSFTIKKRKQNIL